MKKANHFIPEDITNLWEALYDQNEVFLHLVMRKMMISKNLEPALNEEEEEEDTPAMQVNKVEEMPPAAALSPDLELLNVKELNGYCTF